jgi:hypothetical protein
MEGKVLAKLLTALIFWFFCIKTKEHTLLRNMPFMGWMTFSASPMYCNYNLLAI